MRKFIKGFQHYFLGLSFWTKNSSLLRLSIIPLILNFIFLVAGFVFSLNKLPDLVNKIISTPQLWYQYILYYVVLLVTALSLFLIVFFLTFVLANLIAFPFNGIIADRALKIHEVVPGSNHPIFKKARINMIAMVRRTIVFLIIGVILVFAALIPGLGIIGAGIGVFLMAYDRLDYGFDHFALTFNERREFIKAHFGEFLGFAAGFGLTATIPVINILIQPGSIVSGALLVSELHRNRRDSPLERNHSQTSRGTPTIS